MKALTKKEIDEIWDHVPSSIIKKVFVTKENATEYLYSVFGFGSTPTKLSDQQTLSDVLNNILSGKKLSGPTLINIYDFKITNGHVFVDFGETHENPGNCAQQNNNMNQVLDINDDVIFKILGLYSNILVIGESFFHMRKPTKESYEKMFSAMLGNGGADGVFPLNSCNLDNNSNICKKSHSKMLMRYRIVRCIIHYIILCIPSGKVRERLIDIDSRIYDIDPREDFPMKPPDQIFPSNASSKQINDNLIKNLQNINDKKFNHFITTKIPLFGYLEGKDIFNTCYINNINELLNIKNNILELIQDKRMDRQELKNLYARVFFESYDIIKCKVLTIWLSQNDFLGMIHVGGSMHNFITEQKLSNQIANHFTISRIGDRLTNNACMRF
jgi:hypothetical protein